MCNVILHYQCVYCMCELCKSIIIVMIKYKVREEAQYKSMHRKMKNAIKRQYFKFAEAVSPDHLNLFKKYTWSSKWNLMSMDHGQDCPMVKINRILIKFHVILLKIH